MVAHLYNKEVAKAIREVKRPCEFSLDVVAYPEFLTLRVKEAEIMAMNDMNQLNVMEYLQKVRLIVESFGIRCELEGIRYRGR